MTGRLLKIPGTAALSGSYPRFHDAGPHITPGHLAYIDFHHSLDTLTGVPQEGTVIRNLARKEAARLCGKTAAQLADLDWTFTLGSDTGAASFGMERTTRGGLHMMVSRSAGSVNTWASVVAPEAIRGYVVDNPDNTYIMAVGVRLTRSGVSDATGDQIPVAGIEEATVGRQLLRIGERTANGAAYDGDTSPYFALGQEEMVILSGSTWVANEKPADAADTNIYFGAGLVAPTLRNSGYVRKAASLVWRSLHIVDATAAADAAGLTVQDIAEDIKADYARAVATGGRIGGDTVPSDPATAVP